MADNWKKNWQDGKGLGSGLGIASGAMSLFGSAYSMATPDTDTMLDSVDAQVEAIKNNTEGTSADSLDALMSEWTNWRPASLDFNIDDYYVGPEDKDIFTNTLSSTASGATAGAAAGPWGALVGGIVGLGSGLLGGFLGKSKAEKAAEEAVNKLKEATAAQNEYKEASFLTSAKGINAKNNRNMMAQMAYGGPLFAFGGALPGYGGNWSDGLTFIKNGSTHEQNPIGGVPMGMAQDGTPNLVEQGEVIWDANDYVFSDRIEVPEEVQKRYKLKGSKHMTFADAVEKAQEAYAERPNDPIERRGLNAVLAALMQEQELIRQREAEEDEYNEAVYAAKGGKIHIAKNKRGTFTAAAKKHGMGVQEFARHVLANKDKYSPAMRKKANFARNASKWNHALGGHLFWGGGHFDPETGVWIEDGETINYRDPLARGIEMGLTTQRYTPQVYEASLPQSNYNLDLSTAPYLTPEVEITGKKNTTTPPPANTPKGNNEAWMRYLSALGPAVGLGYTLLNRPDHEYGNALDAAAREYAGMIPQVGYTPLGDYLAYTPFDRLFYANELSSNSAATRRGILNSSNSNRGTALAGLLAADYNNMIGLGKLYRQGDEYNLNQRYQVANFNRGTNQYNSEASLKAKMANADLAKARAGLLLDAKMKSLGLNQQQDQAWDAALAANLTGLFDNLGNIGWEAANRNMISTNPALYYDIDRNGKITYKNMSGLTDEEKEYIQWKAERDAARRTGAVVTAKGGYLTIKNRRRRNA